jgi:3-oxoacyl-[acyl-carrier protein] reductase
MVDGVAVVTGAGGAIGGATARRLGEQGLTVLVTDIDAAAAQSTAASLSSDGIVAHPMQHDVTNRGDWEKVIAEVRTHGELWATVNNAGLLRDSLLKKMTDEAWNTVIDVHLRGAFLGCSLSLQEFTSKGRALRGGRIVSLSSTSYLGTLGQGNYAAAKGGIVSLTRVAALEGARYGATANAVAPGSVNTPLLHQTPEETLEQFRLRNPMQRFAEPTEIAAVIAFLISADASYINGQVIHVDGGDSAQV